MQGKKILVVEDEAILALDLRCAIEDLGAFVVGPCYRLTAALSTAAEGGIDGAVLDVDLAGETIFPLADLLTKANVPFVFHTGRQGAETLCQTYSGTAVCPKPMEPEAVARTLSELIASRAVH